MQLNAWGWQSMKQHACMPQTWLISRNISQRSFDLACLVDFDILILDGFGVRLKFHQVHICLCSQHGGTGKESL